LGWIAGLAGKLKIQTPHVLDPIIASSMYLYFKSDYQLPQTEGVENAIAESLNTQNNNA
jgi:hypothetical protein